VYREQLSAPPLAASAVFWAKLLDSLIIHAPAEALFRIRVSFYIYDSHSVLFGARI
jgi:hypothetical protein